MAIPSPSDAFTPRAGLCASCAHMQLIKTAKASTFFLCRLAEVDPTFRKYPVLPVTACSGYQTS